MTTSQLEPEHVYVVRGLLCVPSQPGKGILPARLAYLLCKLEDGTLIMRLRMGGFGSKVGRWTKATRRVPVDNVMREATPRELAVGMPL